MQRLQPPTSLSALLERPFVVMGVLNVTPDSFYDGGRHAGTDAAVAHGLRLADEGADIIDVGGESTRPGAAPVTLDDELRRVVPVVAKLAPLVKAAISIDTTKAAVAAAALDAGASWVNDISAGRFDATMPVLAGERGCAVVLMHSRHTPATMQHDPRYADVIAEVAAELLQSVVRFTAAGVARANIVLDPGIGFSKRTEDNLALLQGLDRLAGLGFPLLIGASRKSLVGELTGRPGEGRLAGSLGCVAAAFAAGARMFRVHDVAETLDVLKVLSAIHTPAARAA
jgi:dihydropteroate synthase